MSKVEPQISSITAFRALNFLVERVALKFDSENLRILGGEMEPAAGHAAGDPALLHTWSLLWGSAAVLTPEGAASVARQFVVREGDWGHDDGHLRLSNQLRPSPEAAPDSVWSEWLYTIDKSRNLADRQAWELSE